MIPCALRLRAYSIKLEAVSFLKHEDYSGYIYEITIIGIIMINIRGPLFNKANLKFRALNLGAYILYLCDHFVIHLSHENI